MLVFKILISSWFKRKIWNETRHIGKRAQIAGKARYHIPGYARFTNAMNTFRRFQRLLQLWPRMPSRRTRTPVQLTSNKVFSHWCRTGSNYLNIGPRQLMAKVQRPRWKTGFSCHEIRWFQKVTASFKCTTQEGAWLFLYEKEETFLFSTTSEPDHSMKTDEDSGPTMTVNRKPW